MAGVVKIGYLKKNKSMRKKFFVLREETAHGGPARLEYYESEKKWRNNALPKKYYMISKNIITLCNVYIDYNITKNIFVFFC